MDTITSTKNPVIQTLRSLTTAKGRRESGCILVEGEVMVREALSCGLEPRCALFTERTEGISDIREKLHCAQYKVKDSLLESVCDTVSPQGIAVSFTAPLPRPVKDLTGPVVILDGVQDPGNCGTIWRTADAAGFGGIIFGTGSVDPLSNKVQRSAMGSAFRLPFSLSHLPDDLDTLKARGYSVIVSSLSGSDIYAASLPEPGKCAVVIGNEAHGVSEDTICFADLLVKLPMRGRAESLNAAVAAGILMYELTRPIKP